MNIVEAWVDRTARGIVPQVAILLIFSVLFWAVGMPTFLNKVQAAYMSQISDELSDSNPNHSATHLIHFTTSTSTLAGQTIKIQIDPDTSAFSQVFSAATTTDIKVITGFQQVANAAACSAQTSEAYPVATYNNGTDESITWTVCPGDTIAPTTTAIMIGSTSTPLWTNPSGAGSYRITIGGTGIASGETRVAILNNVTLTASVNTSFTFTVSGLATSTAVNGDTTTASSTATNLAFGTLVPGTPSVTAQQLAVSTNANNGFFVTVQENQPPTSGAGSVIYLFKDGATTSVPTVWTTPRGLINQFQTYGHFGITSDDADEGGGEFVATTTTPYAANIVNPRVIFSNSGPADGTTQNVGVAKVGYKIQITALQAAGNDYTNTLTYVATPSF